MKHDGAKAAKGSRLPPEGEARKPEPRAQAPRQGEAPQAFFKGLKASVAAALAEDIGAGDLTASLIDPHAKANASVIAREAGVVCGRPWVDEVFRQVDPGLQVDWQVEEGASVAANALLLRLAGKARALLTAERTALNYLQLLSGTASRARKWVRLVQGTGVRLLDTRKTLPGLRLAQKYAVQVGGAANHRFGLYDAFLIKENHIAAAGSIAQAVAAARQAAPDKRTEVEVESLAQLAEALAARPDWILLDNFPLADIRKAVALAQGTGVQLEASGGIASDAALRALAKTGVHSISLGALTKHVQALDLSLRFH